MKNNMLGGVLAGFAAGSVTGLFGAGGGLILVPLLGILTDLEDDNIFPASLSVILPVCLVSLCVTAVTDGLSLQQALPYLAGSAIGGIGSGILGKHIPTKWLHRTLGILILWGGLRYL